MKNTKDQIQIINKYFRNWMEEKLRAEKATKESTELSHLLSLIVDNSEIKLPKGLNERALTILGR